ncbi:MAG: hypothetical protein JXM70_01240 [Pirellulales bacterium]|nr:hypothetical protein [Pirellulales bacterium]
MILMPTAYVDFYPAADPVIYRDEVGTWQRLSAGMPGGTLSVRNISVGEAKYRLRSPVRGYFMRLHDGSWEFLVDGFSPTFVGHGNRADEAYQDWRDFVHVKFQDLNGKRPFEMDEKEQRQWRVLENMIDIVGYRNETPVVVRQIGKVTKARPLPQGITWVDGRSEMVRFDVMPPEFASYKSGQYFEADVERDPLTDKLRRVRYIQKISSVRPMFEGQAQRFWDGLPTTADLPESSHDWTKP